MNRWSLVGDVMADKPSNSHNAKALLDETAKMWRHVAEGLHAWSLIEESLFELYYVASLPRSKYVAAAAFHSVVIFDTKRKMTDATLRTLLQGDPLLEEWIKPTGNGGLCERLRKKAMKRNTLAHGMVVERALTDEPDKWEMVVTPPLSHHFVQYDGYSMKQMNLKELKDSTNSFWDLRNRLTAFDQRLREWLASHGKPLPP